MDESSLSEKSGPATEYRAVRSGSGNRRPRFSARRRIPCAAFWLKKYFAGTGDVSKTSRNEDATATLGDSEVLRIQHSPSDAIPEVNQRPEDGTHIPSSVGGKETRDVFEEEPLRLEVFRDPDDLPEETGSGTGESGTLSSEGDVLAGEPCGKDATLGVESCCNEVICRHLTDVVEESHVGEPMLEHAASCVVDLHRRHGANTCPCHALLEAADAGEKRYRCPVTHAEVIGRVIMETLRSLLIGLIATYRQVR